VVKYVEFKFHKHFPGTERSRGVYDSALYKSTFTYFTYLLTVRTRSVNNCSKGHVSPNFLAVKC